MSDTDTEKQLNSVEFVPLESSINTPSEKRSIKPTVLIKDEYNAHEVKQLLHDLKLDLNPQHPKTLYKHKHEQDEQYYL